MRLVGVFTRKATIIGPRHLFIVVSPYVVTTNDYFEIAILILILVVYTLIVGGNDRQRQQLNAGGNKNDYGNN